MPTFTCKTNFWNTDSLTLFASLNALFTLLLIAGLGVPASSQTVNYFNGFEVGIAPGWDAFGGALNPTRVSSGTNGITSSTGDWHAQVGTGAATNFGGYNSTFPACGYKSSVDIYLNVGGGWANDTRVDYSSAISTQVDPTDVISSLTSAFTMTTMDWGRAQTGLSSAAATMLPVGLKIPQIQNLW